MNSKKGFTLVEVIVVIALIGVLMLLVVPNVVDSFANAKKNMFYNDLLNLYSQASGTYISRSAEDFNTSKVFTNDTNPLDIDSSEDLEYEVEVNSYGQVIRLEASTSDFIFSLSKSDMKKSDIKKSSISPAIADPSIG